MKTKSKITIDPLTMATWEVETAQRQGYDALTAAIETLKSATREIERYRENYVIADTPRLEADCLNWAVNHIASNIIGNTRLDLLASAQARITAANATLSAAKGHAK